MDKPQVSLAARLGIMFAAGVATMLPICLLLPVKDLYTTFTLPGLDQLPPFIGFFLGFNVTRLLLLAVAVVCGFLIDWRLWAAGLLAYWAGATTIPALIAIADVEAYHGQFGFLAVVLLVVLHGFLIFWPVLFGFAGGAVVRILIGRFSSPAGKAIVQQPPGDTV